LPLKRKNNHMKVNISNWCICHTAVNPSLKKCFYLNVFQDCFYQLCLYSYQDFLIESYVCLSESEFLIWQWTTVLLFINLSALCKANSLKLILNAVRVFLKVTMHTLHTHTHTPSHTHTHTHTHTLHTWKNYKQIFMWVGRVV
jgi:hypothetical protein